MSAADLLKDLALISLRWLQERNLDRIAVRNSKSRSVRVFPVKLVEFGVLFPRMANSVSAA